MTYIFTQLPLVTATQPFVGAHGVFEIDKGRTKENAQGEYFAFDINIECTSCSNTAPPILRSIITLQIANVGDKSRYQDKSVIMASGLVVFGVTNQALSFHADASDIRVLGKAESTENLGTIFCAYAGGVQKYLERPAVEGVVSGLLHVDIPLSREADKFAT